MLKRIALIVLLFLVSVEVFAQDIANVSFYQDGSKVVISYEAKTVLNGVSLEISTDGGKTFRTVEKAVSGDVGANISAGRQKIIYSPLDDIGEIRSENVCFKVCCGGKTMRFTAKGVTFEMIFVKGGTFSMGATSEQESDAFGNEKPVYQVTLSDYYIGKYEVTQELWRAVMGKNPSSYKGNLQKPVESISWNDCQKFINTLNTICHRNGTLSPTMNFALPTEAQWEYAARGGNQSQGYKYSGSNNCNEVAYYSASGGPQEVGKKKPNELGIYDMSGNVYEWCRDWYGSYNSSSVRNPAGPSTGSCRIRRGGSWNYVAGNCRVSCRNCSVPPYSSDFCGFRLVCAP